MNGYLGETVVKQEDTKYKGFSNVDMAMVYIERYGGIDGDHHKTWVLDQVARILKGTPIIYKKAAWDDGTVEVRIETGKPSKKYTKWAKDMLCDGEYDYDVGIAP